MQGGNRQMGLSESMINPTRTPDVDSVGSGRIPVSDEDDNHSVYWWLGLFIVFVLYGWLQNKNTKVAAQLKPSNLSANLHNIFFITIAALIGLVGGKIFFVKLAGWTKNIPILGKSIGYIAQLFSAV